MKNYLSICNEKRLDGARVVMLVGSRIWHQNTCATLIASGANVVGICVAHDKIGGLPFDYFFRSLKRRGIIRTMNQVIGRIYYRLLNKKKDLELQGEIFDEKKVRKILNNYDGGYFKCKNFNDKETVEWLFSMHPDVFIVHSGSWVGKEVRAVPRMDLVIGGHPGITPFYRGIHSAFWAVFKGKPEDVGYSVFHLSSGVDTGDLIVQGYIEIEENDSYFTLGWKGMKAIAESQASVIKNLDVGTEVPREPHKLVPSGTEFGLPSFTDYIRYRIKQKEVR